MGKLIFYVFPLSSVVVLAALWYPREAAVTNILLSAPLLVFYLWFALGGLFALVRSSPLMGKLAWLVLLLAPVAILLNRLPVAS